MSKEAFLNAIKYQYERKLRKQREANNLRQSLREIERAQIQREEDLFLTQRLRDVRNRTSPRELADRAERSQAFVRNFPSAPTGRIGKR